MNPFKASNYLLLIFIILNILSFSDVYDDLNIYGYAFIITLFIFNTFNSVIFKKLYSHNIREIKISKALIYFVLFLFFLNILSTQKLPLFELIVGGDTNYKEYNYLSFVYPLSLSLSVYLTICIIYNKIFFNNNKQFKYALLLLTLIISFLGRGLIIIIILTTFFFLFYKYILKFSKVIKYGPIVLLLIFVFGYIGNLRTTDNLTNYQDSKEFFTEIAGANENFEKSKLPDEFLWIYVYSLSPIYNLSNSFLLDSKIKANWSDFIIYNFVPQSIQNVLNKRVEEKDKSNLISDFFNVSTEFNLPYLQKGLLGLCLYVFFKYCIFWLLFSLTKNYNRLLLSSLYSSIFVLSWFSNLFILDAAFIPLVLIVIFTKKNNKKEPNLYMSELNLEGNLS